MSDQGNADEDPDPPKDCGPDADRLSKESRYDNGRQDGRVDSKQ
jgi:hypothetical protein